MKYLDLFSGIGGFALPLSQEGHKCVGFSEIDKYATQIYKKHFPNHKNYGDITKITTPTLPDFDLLVGGFPCQAFSIAGKRRGFEDTRGTLFFEIARILRDKKPRYFLLENVRGLLSHDKGNTFATILKTLSDLGYSIEWQVLNSKDFGVPQNRERVFIIGHLGGFSGRKIFPIGETGRKDNGQGIKEITKNKNQMKRIYDTDGISPTVREALGTSGNKILISENKLKEITKNVQNSKIRRLTPTECERLQGFPDGWTEGISDTQRYKCLGNAVTTNVIKSIIKKL